MGDIKRKRKLFSRPKKLFDRVRMDEENILVERYGLKNKREIWKAKSQISKLRRRAKQLIAADSKVQQEFFDKLIKMGFAVKDISDVLALTEEDLLERRLQTFVFKKKLSNTSKQARQFIVHKYILVKGKTVNTPSFWITKDLEGEISLKKRKVKAAPVEKAEESPVEEVEKIEEKAVEVAA